MKQIGEATPTFSNTIFTNAIEESDGEATPTFSITIFTNAIEESD